MKGRSFEILLVVLFVILGTVVVLSGRLLYLNLDHLYFEAIESTNEKIYLSSETEKVTIELRDAECNVKSYNLTLDLNYLQLLEENEHRIDSLLRGVDFRHDGAYNRRAFFSIEQLATRRRAILHKQLSLNNQREVTEHLRLINERVEGVMHHNVVKPVGNDSLVPVKRKGLASLFGKRKEEKKRIVDSLALLKQTLDQASKQYSDLNQSILSTVGTVKKNQLSFIDLREQQELDLENVGKAIMDELRVVHQLLLQHEQAEKVALLAQTDLRIRKTRNDVLLLIIVLGSTLILTSIVFVSFIRKRNQYQQSLILSRKNAERMSQTRERFLNSMSHELKTPLHAISGFAESAMTESNREIRNKNLQTVMHAAAHLNAIISNILTYSRLERGDITVNPTDINTRDELQQIHALLQGLAENKQLQFHLTITEDVPEHVSIDIIKLTQVVINLLSNAIKFTHQGSVNWTVGTKTIETINYLELSITDTGSGISVENQKKIFEEFNQTSVGKMENRMSSGLGLSITKDLITLMQGAIELKSAENIGTSVTVRLPYVVSQSNYMERPTRMEPQNDAFLKVLFADDNEMNRRLMLNMMQHFPVRLEVVTSGEAVMQTFHQLLPDVVLLDLKMSGLDGYETCKALRKLEKGAALKIYAVTASSTEEVFERATTCGFDGILQKPFDKSSLQSLLFNQKTSTSTPPATTLDFAGLVELSEGDEGFVREMLLLFKNTSHQTLQLIQDAALKKDYHQIANEAHKILASVKFLNAVTLSKKFKELENTSLISQEGFPLLERIRAIESELEIIHQEISELL